MNQSNQVIGDHLELREDEEQHADFRGGHSGSYRKTLCNRPVIIAVIIAMVISFAASSALWYYINFKLSRPPLCQNQPYQNFPESTSTFPRFMRGLENYQQFQKARAKKQISLEGVYLGQKYTSLGLRDPSQQLIEFQKTYLQRKYNLSKYQKQIPMCIAIGSYNNNNNKRIQYNLKSVIRQKYDNYKIIYIDDASTDGTSQRARELIKDLGIPQEKIQIITRDHNFGALANHYLVSKKKCKPQSIFVPLDGDDAFIGVYVLKVLNAAYQSKEVWLVYSNYFHVHSGNLGSSQRLPEDVIKNSTLRSYVTVNFWPVSQLRTFYSKLLASVPEKDLQYQNGTFFSAAYDRAEIHNTIQLAHQRIEYIPELTYLYNERTQYSDQIIHRAQQIKVVEITKSAQKQKRLQCLFYSKTGKCISSHQLINKMDEYQASKP